MMETHSNYGNINKNMVVKVQEVSFIKFLLHFFGGCVCTHMIRL